MKPRIIVITGQAFNCDYETEEAWNMVGADAERVHINRLRAGEKKLGDYDILTIPGGFTFGDDIEAGAIMKAWFSTYLRDDIQRFLEAKKLILGICNGAQIGIKYGLAPDMPGYDRPVVTLTANDSARFECRWVNLVNINGKSVFTEGIDAIELPVAHGEGKFLIDPAHPEVLQKMYGLDLIALKYADPNGNLAKGVYPLYPNGSVDDIAGICNSDGTVLLMMPHPERYKNPTNHPRWTRQRSEGTLPQRGEGLIIFENGVRYCKG